MIVCMSPQQGLAQQTVFEVAEASTRQIMAVLEVQCLPLVGDPAAYGTTYFCRPTLLRPPLRPSTTSHLDVQRASHSALTCNARGTVSWTSWNCDPMICMCQCDYRLAVGTHYWQTRAHWADYSPRYWKDCRAGTTILHHLLMYSRTHSLLVMTVTMGPMEQLTD
jgi:hypothetical protein